MQNCVDEMVRSIAEQLEDEEQIKRVETNQENQRTVEGAFMEWEKCSLSHGLSGICLLYGKLMECYPNEERWERTANRYLGMVVEELNQNGVKNISLFSGLSGVGLAAASVSKEFTNYKKLLSSINAGVLEGLPFYTQNICNEEGTHSALYDVIAGLTGVLSYLYLFKKDTACYQGLLDGINALIRLTQNITIHETQVYGWYIPSKNQFSQLESRLYPMGNFNTSLSHGIAGPLAFLSEMMSKGICREGQKEAVRRIVDFYFTYRLQEGKRDIWKGQIPFEEIRDKQTNAHNLVRRDAWCYGSPGICYALILAGLSLNDRGIVEYGVENLKATIPDIQGIFSPTFCHGYAGIYQILNSVEGLLQKQLFSEEKNYLKEKILGFYEADRPYGFPNIEMDHEKGCFRPYSSTGLLEGATGVALSLLEGEHPGKHIWKRAFLLVS